jgi:hypothetical protein
VKVVFAVVITDWVFPTGPRWGAVAAASAVVVVVAAAGAAAWPLRTETVVYA